MNFRSSATCPLRGSQSDLDSASACTKHCARFMTTATFRCFVCGASGGPIDLVMRFLNKPFLDATRWLADENNIILEEWKPQTSDISHQTSFDASRYARYFDHPFLNEPARKFLFDERRLDPRVVRWCRLTSWTDKQGTPWLRGCRYRITTVAAV